MDQYNEKSIYNFVDDTRNWIANWIGVIVTVLLIGVMFIIASLEGTKEVKASNADSGKLMSLWRDANEGGTEIYPESKVSIMDYKGREYYFVVISYDEENVPVQWYWAYDAGITYIFADYKYYVLAFVASVFAIIASAMNYNSTLEKVINTEKFKKTLIHYQEVKTKMSSYTHLLFRFCNYKNKQTYEMARRDVVEKAQVEWKDFNDPNFDKNKLLRFQKRGLKKVKKINIIPLRPSDLLHEQRFSLKKIRMLEQSPEEHKKKLLVFGGFQKIVTVLGSGLVAGFGVAMTNYAMGILFGVTILISGVSGSLSAIDYGYNKLKQRFIGKADYLNEFINMKEKFIEEERLERETAELAKKKEEERKRMEKEFLESQKKKTNVIELPSNLGFQYDSK